MVLGNPTHAITRISAPNNYLLMKPEYVLSYNNAEGTPNWVEWELNSRDIGREPRSNLFHEESLLPPAWRIEPSLYKGSGFDRGHLCPSGDRTNNREDNYQTFSMVNMVPQAPDNNRGPWEKLEKYERNLARLGKQLYIVAGRIGEGGVGAYGAASKVAERVSVPQSLWKVLIVLNRAGERITRETRAIAVIMPNIQGIKEQPWRSYLTNIDAIEKATGYDLLSNLPINVQKVIESRVDR
jgi:endonuclease G